VRIEYCVPGIAPDLPLRQISTTAEMARAYARYRPPVPPSLIADLIARAGIIRSDNLLDIACGPGRITFPLAAHCASVTGIDMEPEMVAAAQEEAAIRHLENITWKIGRVEETDFAPGTFRLIAVGDAFHRFDQAALLEKVRTWLTQGGAVAILRSHDTLTGTEPWHEVARGVITKWTGKDGARLTAPPQAAQECEAVLKESGYRDVASFTFTDPYSWSIEAVVGNLASTSFCAPDVLADAADDFAADLRRALSSFAPDGVLRETLTFNYTFGVA